ncbi:MAG: hypothetical protein PUE08_03025 [Eubacteriales bacterium]|nr:hypothetical protein [Eubacteriales bacterium]
MDEKNNENQQSIDEILREFQAQKEIKDNGGELEPPKHYDRTEIDFAKTDDLPAAVQENIVDDIKDTEEENAKSERKKPTVNKKLLKIIICIILAAAVVAGAVFGIRYGINASKTAYLKPYEEKYPSVTFPAGISERYCDIYGENPDAVGYIEISETELKSPVLSAERDGLPYAEENTKGSEQFNYVVYLSDNSLEEFYCNADAYNNSASGFITYSDLTDDYNFKVVGAFYTNTKAKDDDGYIFPYNVTEELTADGYPDFYERLSSRFLYNTGITLTRQDTILTLSCPTDYREGFRFVVVGVMRDEKGEKPQARENTLIHYPQVIFDEKGEKNPYSLAEKWYPEIIITNGDGTEKTKQQSIKDYE